MTIQHEHSRQNYYLKAYYDATQIQPYQNRHYEGEPNNGWVLKKTKTLRDLYHYETVTQKPVRWMINT